MSRLSYVFNGTHVANQDGSFGFNVPQSAIFDTHMSDPVGGKVYHKALNLGSSVSAKVDLTSFKVTDTHHFHVRIVFRVDAAFNGTQVIAESNHISFKI